MDQAQWWIIDILLPVVLLIALVWLVFLRRSNRTSDRTKEGAREVYADEERRRREVRTTSEPA
ncbi:MAG TPA: hypothetical protein VFT61_04065 [Sphingomicrobium sp.]|nr:hypothetical protein [Sphingomicrobium sp.]